MESNTGGKENIICERQNTTIQQLKYVIAVIECGSITEASKHLHISQPSLSNAIKDIEKRSRNYHLDLPEKTRFAVSTQHYTFTSDAFVEMVDMFGQDRYEFILNETQTNQIIRDVKNIYSDTWHSAIFNFGRMWIHIKRCDFSYQYGC